MQTLSKYFILDFKGPLIWLRLFNLVFGLTIFGLGVGIMALSGSGVPPWDVLHSGLGKVFGGSIGNWSIIVSFLIIFLWLPLKEKIGLGTILNGIIIGMMIDITAIFLPPAQNNYLGALYVFLGILMICIGSGLYIRAELGAGPRDGLMQGLAKRGPSVRLTRFLLEALALGLGILLGGAFGWGTVAFAILIGPGVQFFLEL